MLVVFHTGTRTYDTVASTRIYMNAQCEDESPVNTRFHGASNACECVHDARRMHIEGQFTVVQFELVCDTIMCMHCLLQPWLSMRSSMPQKV